MLMLAIAAVGVLMLGACADAVDDDASPADDDTATDDTATDDAAAPTGEVEHQWMLAAGSQSGQQIGRLLSLWTERINEHSGGSIEIDIAWLGELVGQGEELAATGDGRVDLMMATNLFHPAEMPLSQVTTLPFTTYDGEAMPRALMDLYDELPAFREEHHRNNIHLLGVLPLDSIAVISTDPWDALDDIPGRSVRAVGNIGQALEIAGADVTALGTGEVYEALQRGAVEAGMIPLDGTRHFGWYEVAPNIQDVGLGQYLHMIIAINLDVWEGLSPEEQSALAAATEDMTAAIHEYFREHDEDSCEVMLDAGTSVTVWDDAEIEAFSGMVGDAVERDWIERTGPEAEELLSRYRELLAEYERDSEWVSGIHDCAEEYERRSG